MIGTHTKPNNICERIRLFSDAVELIDPLDLYHSRMKGTTHERVNSLFASVASLEPKPVKGKDLKDIANGINEFKIVGTVNVKGAVSWAASGGRLLGRVIVFIPRLFEAGIRKLSGKNENYIEAFKNANFSRTFYTFTGAVVAIVARLVFCTLQALTHLVVYGARKIGHTCQYIGRQALQARNVVVRELKNAKDNISASVTKLEQNLEEVQAKVHDEAKVRLLTLKLFGCIDPQPKSYAELSKKDQEFVNRHLDFFHNANLSGLNP